MGIIVSAVVRRSALVALAAASVAASAPHSAAAQARGGSGSQVPCAVPLEWEIADVDSRFGISAEDALRAAREAGSMWEEAVGRDLFRFGRGGAHPIAFEYDERQATMDTRRRLRRELDTGRQDVEVRRAGIEEEVRDLEAARDALARDVEAHGRAMTAYNEEVARWNERGGAPEDVRAELEQRLRELNRRREALESREAVLRARSREIQRDVEALNARIGELRGREEDFARGFTLSASESGRYDETVEWENGRLRSVTRRIRVFQFHDKADLVAVLAHELGHALGLGHAPRRGSVMSEILMTGDVGAPPSAITEVDRAMLASRCPGLARHFSPR